MKKAYINNLRGLDLLRFLLSVSVIIWHYQHFFYPFVSFEKRELFLKQQPFFDFFELFYTKGYYAVQVFWLISGVIFYKVYQQNLTAGKIRLPQFMLNRFSRLYPLHLLTLFIVIGLQLWYNSEYGRYFIYEKNGAQSFFQNLLFVQAWGDNRLSFNGPTWSVSIEIMVYLVFFGICASGLIRTSWGLIGVFIFFMMVKKWELLFAGDDLSSSIYLFFAGCLLTRVYDMVAQNRLQQSGILLILFISWYSTQHTPRIMEPLYERVTGFLYPDLLTFSLLSVWTFIVVFSHQFFDHVPDSVFRFFGDMTYSTYLIHFPIQLLMFLLLKPESYITFFAPWVFVIYLLVVFALGQLTFRFFEVPVQSKLRDLLKRSRIS